MSYCKSLVTNRWASGTVTALTSASALPATNSQSPERTLVWRSESSVTGQYLLCDMGASYACDFLAVANLVRQNGEAVKLYEGGTGGSPGAYNLVATLPAQSDDTKISSIIFGSTSARHWKLEWTNTGAAAYAEVGYVGLGAAVAFNMANATPSVTFERNDPSIESVSTDGQKSYTSRTKYYSGNLHFDFFLEADATLIHAIWNTVGKQTPFFFALDTDLLNQQWLMRMNSSVSWERRGGATPIYRVAFDWEEAR